MIHHAKTFAKECGGTHPACLQFASYLEAQKEIYRKSDPQVHYLLTTAISQLRIVASHLAGTAGRIDVPSTPEVFPPDSL